MRKSNLLELIKEVKKIAAGVDLIIVGSQAAHLVSNFPPELVLESVECDFLLTGGDTDLRRKVNNKFGVFSNFQEEKGIYADALGLATVVLPEGWRARLSELKDESGAVVAYAAEIHDIAVSKLIAGREKDFQFLRAGFLHEFLRTETFFERAESIKLLPQKAVLRRRLEDLSKYLGKEKLKGLEIFLKHIE